MSADAKKQLPTDRGQHLLRVLIQRYIRDGQPVGSRTLSKDSGLDLSPATIRNVMSDLEDLGLVSAPHTSAGRVPTPQGYRMFVDTLVRYRQPGDTEIQRIREQLKGQYDSSSMVSTVSKMLSEFTSMAGVVSVPRSQKVKLRQIEFLPLSEKRVLVILVVNDTEVQNRILHLDRSYTASSGCSAVIDYLQINALPPIRGHGSQKVRWECGDRAENIKLGARLFSCSA